MQGESFRFIHASDFHLESPLSDLDSLPSHLKDALADAPFAASKAVLQAALAENIDFVVLCGDLVSPVSAGPYAMSLLVDYFEQLNEKETPVFWAAGVADDPQKWPDSVALPPNVTLFPKDRVLSIPVQRSGRTICYVYGRSCDGRKIIPTANYLTDPVDEFAVAVGYGNADSDALSEGRFGYWALGGNHNRDETSASSSTKAFHSGSPQGRSLSEVGPHGYTVVDVDAEQSTRIHHIDCDTVRYCSIEIDAEEIASVGSIQTLMSQRIGQLMHQNSGRHLLVGWDINVNDAELLHLVGDNEELLQWARREYGNATPCVWSLRINVHSPSQYPKSWQDEETILGDFLRVATERRAESKNFDLLSFTEEHEGLLSTTTNLLADVSTANRGEILSQATRLGVDLLRGGKPNLVRKS